MKKRFTMPVAVHLFLIKDRSILLLRRFNTGYEDGNFSVVAGHIDGDENYIDAMIREAKEEAGITIYKNQIEPIQVMHRKNVDREGIDYFFVAKQWSGEIKNMEPNKCDLLEWFDLDNLPYNMVAYIKEAIRKYQEGSKFTDFGW
ncbi:NUDIX hydrolase [Oceanirhabdus seepicola]|uniref:NUDIX domain-containing protein n=1 Tax=Oceanirhabdus seepicola TaxID=2828781 RepID=A0A9J6NW63_9CLOT|nr:NUDIX domain-containing protein [Oceanirhabdus seepicola]MCM1988230.1 NUDIX domain-containing protein [Oceanirhabdus seepicola]